MQGYIMKKDLSHLPAGKRGKIRRVLEVLKDFEAMETVILFGSYARGDYVDDPAGNGEDGFPYFSDLDICLIVKSPRQKRRIERSAVLRETLRGICDIRVSLIAHTIRQFNRALENGEYFYVDIVKEGVLLHDSGASSLVKPKNLSPEKRMEKAKEDYEFWTSKGNDFLRSFRHDLNDESWSSAAFHLHQTAENHLTAACLVLSGYRPKGHDVAELEAWCAQFDSAFKDAFPKDTDEDRRLLDLLRSAYVEARYKKSFSISRSDLNELTVRVLALVKRVQHLGETLK